jgi:hypothetical protein
MEEIVVNAFSMTRNHGWPDLTEGDLKQMRTPIDSGRGTSNPHAETLFPSLLTVTPLMF